MEGCRSDVLSVALSAEHSLVRVILWKAEGQRHTHIEFLESGVTALRSLRKQMRASVEQRGALVHVATSLLAWEVKACRPRPPMERKKGNSVG